MNEEWIEDSLSDAEYIKDYLLTRDHKLTVSDYQIIMGLFETDWMIMDHKQFCKGKYGYPNNE